MVPFLWIVFDNLVWKKSTEELKPKNICSHVQCMVNVFRILWSAYFLVVRFVLIFILGFLSLTFLVVLCCSNCFLFLSCFVCLWTFNCYMLDYLSCVFIYKFGNDCGSFTSLTEIQNARGIMDILSEMLDALDPCNREVLSWCTCSYSVLRKLIVIYIMEGTDDVHLHKFLTFYFKSINLQFKISKLYWICRDLGRMSLLTLWINAVLTSKE